MSESMPNTPNASDTTQIGTLSTSPRIEIGSPSNEAKIFKSKAQDYITTFPDENPGQQPSLEEGINSPEPTLPRLPPAELQGGDGTGSRESRSEIPDSEDFLSSSPVFLSVEGVVDNGPASMRYHDGSEDVLVQESGVVMSGEQDNGKNSVSTDIQSTESETSMAEEKIVNSSGDFMSGMVGEHDGLGVLHTELRSVLDNAGSMESCVEKDSNSKHEESTFSASADAPEVTIGANLEAENEREDLGEECVVKDAGYEADNGEDTNAILGMSLDKEDSNQLSKPHSKSSKKMVLEALPTEPEFESHASGSTPATKNKHTIPTEVTVVQDEDTQMSDPLASSAIVEENNEQVAPINNNCYEVHNSPSRSEREEIALRTTESPNPSFTEAATEIKDTKMMEAPPPSAELNDDQSVQEKNSDPIDPLSSLPDSDTNSITTLGETRVPSTASSEKQTRDKQMNEVTCPPSKAKNSATLVSKVPKQNAKASTSQSSSQNQDILLAELKAIKIANIQARTAALEAEIEAKRAKLAEVTKDLKNPAAETVKRHIKLLHDYNDIRDVGQGLVGMIADNRGVRIGEIYGEFGVGVKD